MGKNQERASHRFEEVTRNKDWLVQNAFRKKQARCRNILAKNAYHWLEHNFKRWLKQSGQ